MESLYCRAFLGDFSTNGTWIRRAGQQIENRLSGRTGNDRDARGIGRLVAKSDAQSEGQQQRESEYPEDYFGLAFQLLHASHQQMVIAGPAGILPSTHRHQASLKWRPVR